jgi:replication factor C subunit 2/4
VEFNDDGLTALIFTSEGDMRQAINNLQSTHSGFGFVSGDNVFKVCDQPHPIIVQSIIRGCIKGDINNAMEKLNELWEQGYSAIDIVVTIFRVVKTFDEYAGFSIFFLVLKRVLRMPEYTKLEYVKVSFFLFSLFPHSPVRRKLALRTCASWKALGHCSSWPDWWRGFVKW